MWITVRRLKISVVLILLPPLFFGGCKIIDPPEQIPSYIFIEKIDLNTNYSVEGSNSHAVVDAWIFMNDNLVGVFELPAAIPVLEEGMQDFKIFAGIKNNGISSAGTKYPFYQPYETVINLRPDNIDTITPVVSYYPNLNFWIESFEDPGTKLDKDPTSDTAVVIINNPSDVFQYDNQQNKGSGLISMTSADDYTKIVTNQRFNLPKSGVKVFLELNYKGNTDFNIGVIGQIQGFPESNYILTVRSSDLWKKIYVDLTEVVSTMSAATEYEFYFEIVNTNAEDDIEVFWDNVKLVYP